MEKQVECCSCKKKERSEKEYKDLVHRLNRIEGQVRGIRGMVRCILYGYFSTGGGGNRRTEQF